eukprot:jgi/Picsp_1/4447/NSC_06669-R1_---NA---
MPTFCNEITIAVHSADTTRRGSTVKIAKNEIKHTVFPSATNLSKWYGTDISALYTLSLSVCPQTTSVVGYTGLGLSSATRNCPAVCTTISSCGASPFRCSASSLALSRIVLFPFKLLSGSTSGSVIIDLDRNMLIPPTGPACLAVAGPDRLVDRPSGPKPPFGLSRSVSTLLEKSLQVETSRICRAGFKVPKASSLGTAPLPPPFGSCTSRLSTTPKSCT